MSARPEHSAESRPNTRVRFELIFGSVWLAIGLFVLPAVIYSVGMALLGPYGEQQPAGLGSFYGDFFGDLAQGEVRTWLLALGPLLLISLVRLIFAGTGAPAPEPDSQVVNESPSPPKEARPRREPRVSVD